MSFPRIHLQTFPSPFAAPFHAVAHRLRPPALLGALAGFSFAAAGLLVNGAYFGAVTKAAPTNTEIVNAVTSYINQWQEQADPLVNVAGVGQVKSSNLQGVEIGGQRYYYRLVAGASFDPVSQGQAGHYTTVAVLDSGTQFEVLIYQLDQ